MSRLLTELPPDLAALVEDVTIDSKGRAVPKLYSKLQASKELRAMAVECLAGQQNPNERARAGRRE